METLSGEHTSSLKVSVVLGNMERNVHLKINKIISKSGGIPLQKSFSVDLPLVSVIYKMYKAVQEQFNYIIPNTPYK